MSIVSLKSIHALFFYWLMLQCIEQCKHIHSTVHLCFHGNSLLLWGAGCQSWKLKSSVRPESTNYGEGNTKSSHTSPCLASIIHPCFEESFPVLKGWSLQSFHSWLLLTLKLPNFTHSLEGHYPGLEKSSDFISSLFTSFSWPDHLFLTSLSDLAKCGKAAYCWHNFYQPLHDQ